MSSEGLSAVLLALSGVIGTIFTGIALLRRNRQDANTVDAQELHAHRSAWIWAVRTITRLRAILGQHGIDEPPGIDDEISTWNEKIRGAERLKES